MQFHIILVHPAEPGNIGFIARAMKTHGYESLRVVSEKYDLLDTIARKTGYGSHSLLEKTVFFNSLEEALEDIDLSIGTTSKKRTLRKEVLECRDISGFIKEKSGVIGDVALVFGSEENGLSKSELALCDVVSTIPLTTDYPSLNLSQSVLIYLYELNRDYMEIDDGLETDQELYRVMKEETDKFLDWLEFDNPSYLQRIKDRIRKMRNIDVHMVMTLIKKFKNKGFTLRKD